MHDLILMGRHATLQLEIKPAYDTQPMVVVVSDDPNLATPLEAVCDFLSVAVEHISSGDDLMAVLEAERPMAVITEVDCQHQDGFNVMMTVSQYDPELPVMILTGGDPILTGASEAIEDVFALTAVSRSARTARVGTLVEFLFNASRKSGCMRLLPV